MLLGRVDDVVIGCAVRHWRGTRGDIWGWWRNESTGVVEHGLLMRHRMHLDRLLVGVWVIGSLRGVRRGMERSSMDGSFWDVREWCSGGLGRVGRVSRMGIHVWEIGSGYVFRIYGSVVALVVHDCG